MFSGKLLIIMLSLFIIIISCGEENTPVPDNHLGELGYSCKEDSTCNNDLICNKYKRCIKKNPTCTPNCNNKQCGDDGCNGSCGNCSDTQTCNTSTFQCEGTCTPDCNNKQCGDDGCGGSCGTCSDTQTCNTNTFQCVGNCTPDCNNKQCGNDGCSGSCGNCSDTQTCNTNTFQCVGNCTPDCNNKQCGDDGCSGSCGTCSDTQTCSDFQCINNTETESPNQLIKDRHFQKGFIVVNRSNQEIGTISSNFSNEAPIWQFVFGSSKSTHNTILPVQTLPSGAMLMEDNYSRMIIAQTNMPESDLTLGIWGLLQYDGNYYVPGAGQEWVYHLAQQQISYPGNYTTGSPPISALAKLDFSVFAQLLTAEQNIQSGYNSNYHAAQYLIYFTIQNQNVNSSGLGDYLWFGITIYDDRWEILGLNVQQDRGGTERLIYNLGNEPFITEGFVAGNPGKLFEKDLLPAIRDALTRAWENGFLTGSNYLSDYRIGGMNIGWEVPGLNNVEMRVKNLSLIYEKKAVQAIVFNFNTNGDREGWTAVNIEELFDGPQNGSWLFKVGANTPMLTSPELNIEASTHKHIKIVIANDHNPAETSILKLYWDRFGEKGFREVWSKTIAINNGGGFQTITIDMNNTIGWEGEIHSLRIDPILSGNGNGVGIDSIEITP